MLEEAGDVLLELGLAPPARERQLAQGLMPQQQVVLAVLEFEPVHFDALLERCSLDVQVLAAILVELELLLLVKKLPGNYYLRV